MNLYFIVEGSVTESIVYPKWLEHLLPLHKRVTRPADAQADGNSYYLLSGQGYPQILNEIPNAVENIRENRSYRYLIVCADLEDDDAEEKEQVIQQKLANSRNPLPTTTQFEVILQHRCMESWFLGNRTTFPKNPQNKELKEYIEYYDVSQKCPELMGQHEDFLTHAAFHLDYLRRIFRERGLSYTKRDPGITRDRSYFDRLVDRSEDPAEHLKSFRQFYRLCRTIHGYCPIYANTPSADG
jgi:hypothetical protein